MDRWLALAGVETMRVAASSQPVLRWSRGDLLTTPAPRQRSWGKSFCGGWLAVLALLCGGGSGFAADDGFIGRDQIRRFGLETAWTSQAVLNPGRDTLAHLTMDEDLIYAQGTNGIVSAFDAETGERKWAVQLGRFDEPSFPAISNESLVLVVVGNTLNGIDKRSGDVQWVLRLPGAPSTGPAVDETNVYIGTLDGSVYAFGLKQIRALHLQRKLPAWSHNAFVWRHKAAQEVTSPPLTTGRSVNFASRDGSVYAVTSDRHALLFQFETDAPITAPLARVGDTQFVASEDFTFYAININNGAVRWQVVTGLPMRTAPTAVGEALFISPDRGGLFSLEVATGNQRWWQPRLKDFFGLASGVAFCRDDDANLVLVDNADGRIIGRIAARRYTRHIVNDRTDRLYVATDSGRIAALRFSGREIPVFHKFPERLPILPEFEPEEAAADSMEPAPTQN